MERAARKFVLFDFDGVIADSFALGADIARIVHPAAQLTPEKYRTWFEGNVYDSLDKHGVARNDTDYFTRYSERMNDEVKLFSGMDAVVSQLAKSYTLIIVSSTTSALIRRFLSKHGLEQYFSAVMGSDVHASKVEKIRMIFDEHELEAHHCVFITDTLGDMREANKHRVETIGVAWGWHPRETLEKGVPFRIVDHPRELPDAIDDYFERNNSI